MNDSSYNRKKRLIDGAESFFFKSPLRTFIAISAAIFFAEALVMILFYIFTGDSGRPAALLGYSLLDSTLLVILLAPILYFLIFRQMLKLFEERKKAYLMIMSERDAAQRYLDIAGVMLVAVDISGKVEMINKKGCEILGVGEEDVLGRDWLSFVPTEEAPRVRKIFDDLRISQGAPDNYECPILGGSGGPKVILWHTRPVVEDGRLVVFLSSGEDVTEIKRAMAALVEAETRYRLVHATAFDGILIAGEDDRIAEANQSAEALFGYPPGGLVGLHLTEIMPSEFRQMHLAGLKRFLETGVSMSQGKVLELKGLKKDGGIFPIEVVIGSFKVGARAYFTGTIRDVSGRKRIERERELARMQISKSQKMETLGRLTGGIAHDFNNVLTAIRGNVELAMEEMDKEGHAFKRLAEINDTIKHAARLTRQLLLFSRGRNAERAPFDLNSAVTETIKMIKRIAGPDVLVTTELDETLMMINADATNM